MEVGGGNVVFPFGISAGFDQLGNRGIESEKAQPCLTCHMPWGLLLIFTKYL
jgi:hypothetical protein